VDGLLAAEAGGPGTQRQEGDRFSFKGVEMAGTSTAVVWLVSSILVLGAIIDGRQLRVPNWLTYPFFLSGLMYAGWTGGFPALAWSFAGGALGLICLLSLYSIGGMGSGDVKLMAGVGAWMGPWTTLYAFVGTALVGGLLGLIMMVASGEFMRHVFLMHAIGQEILTVRNPTELARRAAERKPAMTLLPYGIPIALGSIASFAWMGMYFR